MYICICVYIYIYHSRSRTGFAPTAIRVLTSETSSRRGTRYSHVYHY